MPSGVSYIAQGLDHFEGGIIQEVMAERTVEIGAVIGIDEFSVEGAASVLAGADVGDIVLPQKTTNMPSHARIGTAGYGMFLSSKNGGLHTPFVKNSG